MEKTPLWWSQFGAHFADEDEAGSTLDLCVGVRTVPSRPVEAGKKPKKLKAAKKR